MAHGDSKVFIWFDKVCRSSEKYLFLLPLLVSFQHSGEHESWVAHVSNASMSELWFVVLLLLY